ncbi:MAG: hypothetical protein NVSMB57_07780 [Actinomycetota bacterium]
MHGACKALLVLYRDLEAKRIDLLGRLHQGKFLTLPEVDSIVVAAQSRLDDPSDDEHDGPAGNGVVNINTVRMRRQTVVPEVQGIARGTMANRLRYIRSFLDFLAEYVKADLPRDLQQQLTAQADLALKALAGQVPRVPKRSSLGAREGLSKEDADRVLAVVRPDSSQNPWKRGFVRHRNWIIVMILLATGMRRGELAGMKVGDLQKQKYALHIVRRADDPDDQRRVEENTKTQAREVELRPGLMRSLDDYLRERRKIPQARKIAQLIVSDEGTALTGDAIGKIFGQVRAACPGLPVRLTSHVFRHTWNERFSEEAEKMGLSDQEEQMARNVQQGWTDDSKTGADYTRRHTRLKGQQISLKLQEDLDATAG